MLLALALWLGASTSPLPILEIWHGPEEIFALARQSERPTVVHFWATWCDQCVRELPEIVRLERGLQDSGVPLLCISLDAPESLAKVAAFMQERALPAEPSSRAALLDAPDPKPITARFNAHWHAELPATFVVLQSGAVAASHLGTTPVEVILKEVRDQIATSHAGQPSPARRTK
jgi:thiol-disulfide isomerase/thioredoxin